ncbi:ribosomal protein L10-domain-containing protein [Polychytrium aggregatum]|uniref:ribosomal protein L10-domain-containing protein n=1 Tax=Polychytrium aggregatum TaxID=110093 RepID=UPI0022FE3D46|nr:ribosomal protein L10-domain-containing protein [Polychytrium aggregatum]KAI9199756.1 ribosomal protein L10-domain-containing protein [Polychytrium aggregatum]
MSKGDARAKKEAYFQKLEQLLEEYPSIFIVNVDNVGSNQMHQIRQSLRGSAVILMGKNTMVRCALRKKVVENPSYEHLLKEVVGNVGFVFTKGDLKETREKILANRVRAPAKAGALAPVDVHVPAGNTGMEPGKTSFFQALGIPTKIARGTIEIVNDVHLVKAGSRVGPSEATLLNMLNISPFTYGLSVVNVFSDGAVFSASLLDVEEESLIKNLVTGIATIASLSLAIGFPTVAAVPHILVNGYKNLIAVALASEVQLEAADKIKEILADPSKFAALAAAAAPAEAAAPAAAAAAAAPAKAEEPEEEEDDDMGFGLFD